MTAVEERRRLVRGWALRWLRNPEAAAVLQGGVLGVGPAITTWVLSTVGVAYAQPAAAGKKPLIDSGDTWLVIQTQIARPVTEVAYLAVPHTAQWTEALNAPPAERLIHRYHEVQEDGQLKASGITWPVWATVTSDGGVFPKFTTVRNPHPIRAAYRTLGLI